jgi:hypothetical protein
MKNKFVTIVILTIAALAAIVLGSNVARGNYEDLLVYVVIAVPLVFVFWAHRYTWQICAFLILGGIAFYQGFIFTSIHVGVVLILAMFVNHFLSRVPPGMPDAFRKSGGGLLLAFSFAWLAYAALHFAGNFSMPHVPGDFGVKNSAKAYFAAVMPAVILVWILIGPTRFQVSANWDRQLVWILFMALIVNIGYMGILYIFGFGEATKTEASAELMEARGLHIPVINAAPHVFGLRTLGPTAILFSMLLLTAPKWLKSQSRIIFWVLLAVLMLGVLGAVMSGGRAAVVVGGFYGFVVLLSRRRLGLIFFGILAGILGIFAVNLFSDVVNNNLPKMMARPLTYLMLEKRADAVSSIENSTDYRKALYKESIEHWKSEPRIMLTGRSIYEYLDNEMDLRVRYGDKENFIVTNLRAGTCHALLPSSLVQYGALGTLLYYIWNFTIIQFCWRLSSYCRKNVTAEDLRTFPFAMTVMLNVNIIVATVGGTWTGLTAILFIGIFASRLHQVEGARAREEISNKKETRNFSNDGGLLAYGRSSPGAR